MEYREFLEKSRKRNGERYLPKTINLYVDFVERYKDRFVGDFEEIIQEMNKIILEYNQPNLRASFKAYLLYLGLEEEDERFKFLKPTKKRASAINSLRMLGEKVIQMKDMQLLYSSLDDEWKLIVGFLYDTACRENEMLNVKWRDITFKENGAEVVVLGKGSKPRTVFLSQPTCNLLKKLRPNIQDMDLVFVFRMRDGTPMARQGKALYDGIRKRTKQILGMEKTPHCFRHCVSEDTMILTQNGWKYYEQLSKGDSIFTLNLKKNVVELEKVRDIFTYNVKDEEMVHIKHKYSDLLVTKDHKNIMRVGKDRRLNNKKFTEWGNWSFISYDDYNNMKNKRQTHFRVSGIKKEGKSIGIHKAKIIGWALSDGSLVSKGLVIYQSASANPHKCEIIRNTLIDSGLKFTEHIYSEKINLGSRMTQFRLFTRDTKWLYEYINEKRMPKWKILELPYEELNAVYETMMLGDGHKLEYSVQNKERIEFFRTLLVMIGKRSIQRDSIHNITKNHKFRTHISNGDCYDFKSNKHWKKEKYSGIVWCPNTINGTFFAKRNNTICITGNTKLTHLSENGADILGVSSIAGHSNISTTNIYTKMSKVIAKKTYETYTQDITGEGE